MATNSVKGTLQIIPVNAMLIAHTILDGGEA